MKMYKTNDEYPMSESIDEEEKLNMHHHRKIVKRECNMLPELQSNQEDQEDHDNVKYEYDRLSLKPYHEFFSKPMRRHLARFKEPPFIFSKDGGADVHIFARNLIEKFNQTLSF